MQAMIFMDKLDEDLIKKCYSVLNSILCEYGIPFAYYSLGEYMDDYECLEYCDKKWVVYTGERGEKLDEKAFDDFYTASCFLFESVVFGYEKQEEMRSVLRKRLEGMLARNSIYSPSVISVKKTWSSDAGKRNIELTDLEIPVAYPKDAKPRQVAFIDDKKLRLVAFKDDKKLRQVAFVANKKHRLVAIEVDKALRQLPSDLDNIIKAEGSKKQKPSDAVEIVELIQNKAVERRQYNKEFQKAGVKPKGVSKLSKVGAKNIKGIRIKPRTSGIIVAATGVFVKDIKKDNKDP